MIFINKAGTSFQGSMHHETSHDNILCKNYYENLLLENFKGVEIL